MGGIVIESITFKISFSFGSNISSTSKGPFSKTNFNENTVRYEVLYFFFSFEHSGGKKYLFWNSNSILAEITFKVKVSRGMA